jgi:hypothetical protein
MLQDNLKKYYEGKKARKYNDFEPLVALEYDYAGHS